MASMTVITYTQFQEAFDYFRKALLPDVTSDVLLTLAPHNKALGYYRHQAFKVKGKKKDKVVHEISLNPFTFKGRSREDILSTIVHEMCHLWQYQDVKEMPKSLTHSKEWADKMESLGLMPSSTGAEGGKRTGKKVSHYIIPGGAFAKAVKKCKVHFAFSGSLAEKEKKGAKRTKYICPSCGTNCYGKPSLNIVCGECDEQFEEQVKD